MNKILLQIIEICDNSTMNPSDKIVNIRETIKEYKDLTERSNSMASQEEINKANKQIVAGHTQHYEDANKDNIEYEANSSRLL